METDSDSMEIQSILQPEIDLIEPNEMEPMDFDVELRPIIPQFTYSKRKRFVQQ